jgi:uncharacterized membrane protein YgdD (TMEM256/DUF423 family)
MNKKLLIIASILGILGIVLGAFAAHGLEKSVTNDAIDTFETGVRYQMYHALFLLFIGMNPVLTSKAKKTILTLVILGVLFFSGSIYGLATNELSGFDFKKIAFITPIGGSLLIISWVVLLINIIKYKDD